VDADGVQLPGNGLAVRDARRIIGSDRLIGVSLHDTGELERAADADFVLFGPVFATESKRRFGPPQGLERLAEFVAASTVPVCAVGGITAERVPEVIAAGAAGVAVIGAVFDRGAEHAALAAEELRHALGA
jgi:thiamine-phosphate pyrophosphorylase